MSDPSHLWQLIRQDALSFSKKESLLEDFFVKISSFQNLGEGVAFCLSEKFHRPYLSKESLFSLFTQNLSDEVSLTTLSADIDAVNERDPACKSPLYPLVFLKGFLGLCSYRIASKLFKNGRKEMSFYLQSLTSEIFAVDIHPKAQIGKGILLDHATSFVAGETAIIEDEVSILHEVTLGGNGKDKGERHPIIRSGVLLGAGAKVLGRVEIGKNSKVGAGSVVLENVPPYTTVAGVPAIIVASLPHRNTALEMDHSLNKKPS